jgi:hypothetical protein
MAKIVILKMSNSMLGSMDRSFERFVCRLRMRFSVDFDNSPDLILRSSVELDKSPDLILIDDTDLIGPFSELCDKLGSSGWY